MSALSKERRVQAVIVISLSFFLLELVIGFRSRSLALIADAFHVASDLIGFAVALAAIRKQRADASVPSRFTFGWQRAEVVGAFFNGVFLLALGVSILLQTIERFLAPEKIKDAKLVLIVGGIGLGTNALSALVLGGHGHSHGGGHDHDSVPGIDLSKHAGHAHTLASSGRGSSSHDLGILGVVIHLVGDAINNVAVMVAAGVFLGTGFIYADPIASAFVGVMILVTALPLTSRSGRMLLESAPPAVDFNGVRKDIASVARIKDLHEMHIWNLTESKTLATMHVAITNDSITEFMSIAQKITECLHHWGIHNVTIQPELVADTPYASSTSVSAPALDAPVNRLGCRLRCTESNCEQPVCCD